MLAILRPVDLARSQSTRAALRLERFSLGWLARSRMEAPSLPRRWRLERGA